MKKSFIDKEDALANLRVALLTLNHLGVPGEEILRHCTEILIQVSNQQKEQEDDKIKVHLLRRKIWGGKSEVYLTVKEAKLFQLLFENAGDLVTHKQIFETLKDETLKPGADPAEYSRPMISRLIKKLNEIPRSAECIEVVRGDGYTLVGKERFERVD